jgi:hypothetical protein
MGFDIPFRGGNVTETHDFVTMTIGKIFEELEVPQSISSTGINYVQLQLEWMSSQNGYDGGTGDKSWIGHSGDPHTRIITNSGRHSPGK